MNRNSAVICSAVLLAGACSGFIGGLWYAGKRDPPGEMTPAVISETGWEFTSGLESGPALVAGPHPLTLSSTAPAESDSPDIAWFPEAIAETPATPSLLEAPPPEFTAAAQPVPSGPLTPQQRKIWHDQLRHLPAGEAEQLLQIRQSLNAESSHEPIDPLTETPGRIKPLSATASGDLSPPKSAAVEPGRLPVLAGESLRPALPAGPLLPPDIDLASASRTETALASPLLKQVLQATRLNRANAATVGYRRREVLVMCAETSLADENSGKRKTESQGDPLLQVSAEATGPAASRDEERNSWTARLDLRHGEILATENPLDVAITGAGWFRVRFNGEDVFTRCGLLAINEEHQLAVRTGVGTLPLEPVITLPGDLARIEFANDGTVLAHLVDTSEVQDCGKIELVSFRDAGQLAWSAKGFYEATVSSGKPSLLESARAAIRQGHLEQSNVDMKLEAATLERVRAVISFEEGE